MTPNLVIGGGLAGSALALRLAQAGRPVLLLEREAAAHDKVCGEFLSYEAVGYLNALGLDPEALGAVSLDEVRLFHRGARAACPLPFSALSLSRRVLDEALLRRAADLGVEVRRGVRVTSIRGDGAWTINTDRGETIKAGEVFLATGKHDIRGHKRPPGAQPDLVGFKTYWRLPAQQAERLARTVELHLFAGGYAGLEPVEGDKVNLCLVVRKAALAQLGGAWPALLARVLQDSPALAERLRHAAQVSAKPLAIAAIPYGYVRESSDGLWRLGDQAAVIPSFSGEGMSIALHSAELAASHVLQGRGPAAYQHTLARHVKSQVRRATWVSQALVHTVGQDLVVGVARLWPGVMRLVASGTRLPRAALDELPKDRPHAVA